MQRLKTSSAKQEICAGNVSKCEDDLGRSRVSVFLHNFNCISFYTVPKKCCWSATKNRKH